MNANYAIEILTERLNLLERAYDKHVKYGNVQIDNKVAIDNREKVNSINEALKKLKQ